MRFLPPDVDRKALLPALERIFAKGALAAVRVAILSFHVPTYLEVVSQLSKCDCVELGTAG